MGCNSLSMGYKLYNSEADALVVKRDAIFYKTTITKAVSSQVEGPSLRD